MNVRFKPGVVLLAGVFALVIPAAVLAADKPTTPIDIGSRIEPLVDDFLIDTMKNAALQLQHPTPKNAAIVFDKPWEGNTSCYVTVFKDDDRYRMYYRGSNYDLKTKKHLGQRPCYAESKDGIHWTKPELGLFEFAGSKKNNIVWQGPGEHNFAPFKDTNPNCQPDAKYKALATGKGGLIAFKSADAIHWSLIREKPVITKGAFDSQNLAFYDNIRKRYVDFHRGFQKSVRDIMTCTSQDFVNWTDPVWLDWGETPREHLYTNAITPYFRAPHIFVGFPKRLVPSRQAVEHPYPGVSDGVFMTSRDGLHWNRWTEAFIRPGLNKERWVNRNNMTAWGILVTKSDIPGAPDELSLYSSEGYYVGPCRMRRFALRIDGFVSVHGPYAGGEMVTKPLFFAGKHLVINYATSAAGSVRVEIQDAAGKPIKGYVLADSTEIFGDQIQRVVSWNAGDDLGGLAGKPIRLRFQLKDADLYSIRFSPKKPGKVIDGLDASAEKTDATLTLFGPDTKSLDGWRIPDEIDFSEHGKVYIKDGAIVLDAGRPATGISWKGPLPRDNYEVTLEGMRVEGNDFFCGMTFPVGKSPCSLILGGWGGGVVGLSNVNDMHAAENETSTGAQFDNGKWYRIRLRVTTPKIEVWINDDKMIDLERADRRFSIWFEQEPVLPFGIATWYTKAALRNIKITRL